MITKGQIVELNFSTSNIIKVRVPIFEPAGSPDKQIIECALCYQPGNLRGYKIGDVVFVSFEDNNIDKGVILGKLYIGDEEEYINNSFNSSLKVVNEAILPTNTKIGSITGEDLAAAIKILQDIQNKLYKGQ